MRPCAPTHTRVQVKKSFSVVVSKTARNPVKVRWQQHFFLVSRKRGTGQRKAA